MIPELCVNFVTAFLFLAFSCRVAPPETVTDIGTKPQGLRPNSNANKEEGTGPSETSEIAGKQPEF